MTRSRRHRDRAANEPRSHQAGVVTVSQPDRDLALLPADGADAARRAEFAACVGLLVEGVYATCFGPALPVLAGDFAVSLDTVGLLLTMFFAGSIATSALVAARLHRRDPHQVAVAGLCAAALGVAGLAVAGEFRVALAATLLMGAGDGLLVAGAHLLVARASADIPRGMNRLNLYFAFGAMLGPLWAGSVLQFAAPGRAIAFGGVALAVAFAAVAMARAPSPSPSSSRNRDSGRGSEITPAAGGVGVLAALMGAVLFLYVGAEFGLGSWVATYAAREFGTGLFTGGVVTSCYWGALLLGRFASGQLFARGWQPPRVLLLSIGGSLIASAAIAAAHGVFAIVVLAALATGLFLGPVWPAVMSIVAARSTGGAPASIVTVGNAGGVFFPWLQGRLIVQAGATTGIALTALLCGAMLLLAGIARVLPDGAREGRRR